MNNDDADTKALEAFIVDNPELEQLESLLDQFNLFEALGAVRVELRHSDFLAFLLSPSQNHGLGDTFAKRLLQKALISSAEHSSPVSLIDLDTWDLDELVVMREWQNIDILLVDERNKLVVIIENKIDSIEQSSQLSRYWKTVKEHYGSFQIVGLFLTPEGDQPSHENYLAIDYSIICAILEKLTQSRSSSIGPDIQVVLKHYIEMLKRHIMNESQVAELCRKIYRKHQRAIDMIYEYRPDEQLAIREILEKLIKDESNLVLDHCTKSYIRFAHSDWQVLALNQGEGWTNTGRMLLFQFNNVTDRLWLYLTIGPGPIETRQRLHDLSHSERLIFKPANRVLNKKWNTIYDREFLSPKTYHEKSAEEKEAEIRKKWKQFLENDLPQIQSILKSEAWIWRIQ
jgi:hypothetical protein